MKSGTSFAVPQIAGAAAVLQGIDPALTPEKIMELMAKTATDQGAEGYDNAYGYGILNLAGCIEALAYEAATASKEPAHPPEDDPLVAPPDCTGDAACPISAFTDADPTAWYHDGVHFALANGLMNGIGNGKFAPNDNTSRAMIATVVMRYLERFAA